MPRKYILYVVLLNSVLWNVLYFYSVENVTSLSFPIHGVTWVKKIYPNYFFEYISRSLISNEITTDNACWSCIQYSILTGLSFINTIALSSVESMNHVNKRVIFQMLNVFIGECFIRLWNSNYVDMHVNVEIQLISTCRYGKNMPTTALLIMHVDRVSSTLYWYKYYCAFKCREHASRK